MSVLELKAALAEIPGIDNLTISYHPNGNQILNLGDKSLEVSPMASNEEIRAALQNPFVPTRNTRITLSAIDRLKQKALEARGVAPEAIKKFEADLDSILAEKAELEKKRVAAVSVHHEAIAGIKGELDGLKSTMDILTNGAPE